ncbi:LPS export ABC transporter periplasmic protein LptC, partial [Rhodospirillum rubrum]|uniref:LPS export ABC transporter periplasmic protein LptC n=2 Tax=Rhodospirillum rubrum TaxID=1085 RepID=UPI001906C7D9
MSGEAHPTPQAPQPPPLVAVRADSVVRLHEGAPPMRPRKTRPPASSPQGYSRFVALMKLLLPSLAAAMLGVVLAWPQIADRTESLNLDFSALDPSAIDLKSVVNPRYLGTDSTDQPFTVTADLATEMGAGDERTRLTNPKGDLTQSSGKWLSLSSDLGYLTDQKQVVDLESGVLLYRDDGFQFQTNAARIHLDTDEAMGDQPVKGQGPGLEIVSEGFRVLDGGNRILFTGKAKLVVIDTNPTAPSPAKRLATDPDPPPPAPA